MGGPAKKLPSIGRWKAQDWDVSAANKLATIMEAVWSRFFMCPTIRTHSFHEIHVLSFQRKAVVGIKI